jgi:hypothetical protein
MACFFIYKINYDECSLKPSLNFFSFLGFRPTKRPPLLTNVKAGTETVKRNKITVTKNSWVATHLQSSPEATTQTAAVNDAIQGFDVFFILSSK